MVGVGMVLSVGGFAGFCLLEYSGVFDLVAFVRTVANRWEDLAFFELA